MTTTMVRTPQLSKTSITESPRRNLQNESLVNASLMRIDVGDIHLANEAIFVHSSTTFRLGLFCPHLLDIL